MRSPAKVAPMAIKNRLSQIKAGGRGDWLAAIRSNIRICPIPAEPSTVIQISMIERG